METTEVTHPTRKPWNKGKLTGQKAPLKLPEIWAIRVRLQLPRLRRDLAMFNLAIDSKLSVALCRGKAVTLLTAHPDVSRWRLRDRESGRDFPA